MGGLTTVCLQLGQWGNMWCNVWKSVGQESVETALAAQQCYLAT